MKFLIFSAFLLALAGTTLSTSASWGIRGRTDILLSRELVVRAPIKNNYWTVNVDFPRAGSYNNYPLTAIYVYDNFRNNSGAYPNLWSGGPGYTFARINLQSQVARGINSTVEFWVRR